MNSTFWRITESKNLDCMRVVGSRHCFPRHWHETYVIEILEEGTNEFWCEGQIYSADPGDILVIHPAEIHTGYPSGDNALSYRSIYPDKDLMTDLCRQVRGSEDPPRFRSHIIRDRILSLKFEKAHSLMEKTVTRMMGHRLMILVLAELISRYSEQSEPDFETPAFSFSQTRMQQALDFLAEKYDGNISLTELSSLCGLSEYHFLRTFKKSTGIAPYEYVIATRVEESRKLISRGVSIAEAAARTGFFDQSHLNRHFKRILGITPGKYACIP